MKQQPATASDQRIDHERIVALEGEVAELRRAVQALAHPHQHWCNNQRSSGRVNRNEPVQW